MVAPKNQGKDGKGKAAIAAPSDKLQAADETSQQADQFESEITDLKVKYDQYFLGLERFEPNKERDALKARLVKFKQGFIRNTGVRFRVQAQYQKFLSYERMWMRIAREIEEGTYSRDLFKAKMRGDKRKNKDEHKKKKGEAFDLSAEESDLAGGDAPEPKTDPHLSIPPELLDEPPLVMPKVHAPAAPPLIVPQAARPPPPPPGMAAKSGSMPAIEPQRPGSSAGSKPPPPPTEAFGGGSRVPSVSGVKPPPPPVQAQASRISGPQPVVAAASAKTSGPQPLVVPTSAKATGPLPAVAPARATSNPGTKVPPPPPPGSTGRATPPPPPSSATSPGPRPPPPPSGASGVRPPPSGNVGLGEDKMKAIVSAYIAAKRQCKESTDGITYESVSKSINSQVPELMKQHNAKAVDFKVVIKNGKATLKAVPKV